MMVNGHDDRESDNDDDDDGDDDDNDGNSIVYRNHKNCDGFASLCDGVPSYIVL